MVGLLFGLTLGAHAIIGDICAFDERRRLLSISSSTMSISKSPGSSIEARLTVKLRSCSANRSQPKNCLISISLISRALRFLKAISGTAVSNGNSSYPEMSLARRSGVSLRQGILVKAEYRYFRSSLLAACCLSILAAELVPLRPKLDQSEDIPDMTLRILETECIEPWSEPPPFGLLPRKET